TVGATASSGLPVSFSAGGACTVAGTTVHLTGAGSCTITASQAGNADYQAAADVSQSLNVAKADQSITFSGPPDQTFGDPDFEVDASASSGLPVSLSVTFGECTLSSDTSPAQLHLVGAGSCTITASQEGDDYNAAADQVRTFSIAMGNQTITFGSLADHTYGDPDFTVSATASSGLDVSFSASGTCTVSGNTVHITDAGPCSITASQAGDADWNPAPDVTQSFTIDQASQTITFAAIPDHTYGDADFTVAPTASSGLPVSLSVGAGSSCTLSGFTVHLTAPGSCSLTASQAGNTDYQAAADVTVTFQIAKVGQTITFAAIPNHTYGDPDFKIHPTASSGLPVSLSVGAGSTCTLNGSVVHITGAGSCSITASQAGSAIYAAAPNVTQSFTIAKLNQAIFFLPIPNQPYGTQELAIEAFATSREPVSLSASGSCTLSSPTAPAIAHLPLGFPTCTITASQPGDANWAAAANVTRTFSVVNSPQGTADGTGLQPSNGGSASFHVDADPPGRAKGPSGTLQYTGPTTKPVKGKPTPPPLQFQASSITAFGIGFDGRSAWFSGVGKDGRSFVAYVEDNGGNRHSRRDNDVFELWINGTLQTGDGSLDSGNVSISTR